jgi:DNA polymerase IV
MLVMAVQPVLRKIIHVDMDAFYASIEQRDDPALVGKPIVVGGSPEGRGGVVATASYEARRFGIHSAMPSKRAKQLCPRVIFVKPRFEIYKSVSRQLREIFYTYTDLVEPLSLDEAYLDVTVDKKGIGSALEIAGLIKNEIREKLNLTASAGVSVNKFLAKTASDLQKPDGLTFIGPSRIEAFMESLPVEKFHGVGKVTATRMKTMGIHTGADIKRLSEAELLSYFGKAGMFYYQIVRGIDNREVTPHRETKSVGAEDTFPYDLTLEEEMLYELEKLARTVSDRLMKKQLRGKSITLKVKFSDFRIITRSHSVTDATDDRKIIFEVVKELLADRDAGKSVRLLGISISNFSQTAIRDPDHLTTSNQLRLF